MAMSGNHGDIDIRVTVKTTELLERLTSNREKHAAEFDAAIAVWQEELERVLKELDARECTEFPQSLTELHRECPVSHVDEYDQAIDMFSMCTKEEVTLDSESFNTFCRDDWGWKGYVSENRFYRSSSLRQ